eukprot:scaffold49897_cov32-Tisochrysis_lutea.AAC.4
MDEQEFPPQLVGAVYAMGVVLLGPARGEGGVSKGYMFVCVRGKSTRRIKSMHEQKLSKTIACTVDYAVCLLSTKSAHVLMSTVGRVEAV